MDRRSLIQARLGWLSGSTWLLAAFLSMASPAQAQRVEAYLSTDSATVGDRFTLTLVALHGFASEPLFPDPSASDSTFGDLEVLEITSTGGHYLGADNTGGRLDSVVYEVTTFALDTAFVPAIPVFFAASADTSIAASLPMMLPIASLVPADAERIRDLTPLVDFAGPIWPYVLLGLALMLALGLLYYYLRQRRQEPEPTLPEPMPEPRISPYEVALSRLRMLETTPVDVPQQIKPFFVELSDLLRTYLEDSLEVPALERTTRELMIEFERRTVRHKLPGGAPQRVHGILELADLVKFADLKPPSSQSKMALDETRKTVDVIEAKLRQIAMDRERMAPRVHLDLPKTQEHHTSDVS